MANYSFSVKEGQAHSFSIRVFGVAPDMSGKMYVEGSLLSGASITTLKNTVSVSIPFGSLPDGDPSLNYRVDLSSDNWQTNTTAIRGTIFVDKVTTSDPDNNGGFIVLNATDPLPDNLADRTVVIRISS